MTALPPDSCAHLQTAEARHAVKPSGHGCVECLKSGSVWVHLRLCLSCGHVGCCDNSPNRHATKHSHATSHPVIRSYEPPELVGLAAGPAIPFAIFGELDDAPGLILIGLVIFAAAAAVYFTQLRRQSATPA